MAELFVSYSRRDSTAARRLIEPQRNAMEEQLSPVTLKPVGRVS